MKNRVQNRPKRTRRDILRALEQDQALSKISVTNKKKIVRKVIETISRWLSNKDNIHLKGIGTFTLCQSHRKNVFDFKTRKMKIGKPLYYKFKLSDPVKRVL